MNKFLGGKKVLFVAPRFFGYEQEIQAELERQGAIVDFLVDRPFSSPFLRAITTVWRSSVIYLADRYYRKKVMGFGSKQFDLIFVINGQTLSSNTLSLWKYRFPRAKFVLYAWDSFKNRRHLLSNLPFFDACFTFDSDDATKYRINFRPLFFTHGFERQGNACSSIDVSFVGTAHTNRYLIVSKIMKNLEGRATSYVYFFLQAKWVFYLYKMLYKSFRTARISEFHFIPLPKSDVHQIFQETRIILDVEHSGQNGLTIRTLEALGAKKKLITTNKNIVNYDFFSNDNICVIDRENVQISDEFLCSPYVNICDEIYDRYKLAGWLEEIMRTTFNEPCRRTWDTHSSILEMPDIES